MYIDSEDYVYTNLTEAADCGKIQTELLYEKADMFILFGGRHPLPEHASELRAVFLGEVDPVDFEPMETRAAEVFKKCGDVIYLYVTGLTAATVACINAARHYRKTLWLCHFDRLTQGYKRQEVL